MTKQLEPGPELCQSLAFCPTKKDKSRENKERNRDCQRGAYQNYKLGKKSDTVRLPKMLAEHNLTLNPFYIDEEYFDKEKREYLYALGPEGEYQN